MKNEEQSWFEPKATTFREFIKEVSAWFVAVAERREATNTFNDGVSPGDSVSAISSRRSKKSRESSGSSRVSSVASSARLKTELEKAALLAKAAALKQRHVLDEQELKVKAEKEQLELQAALAAADAQLKVLQKYEESSDAGRDADASEVGYGTVTYLVQHNRHNQIHCAFVLGKARVAPLKPTTIPRLELTAATLATRVDGMLRREIQLPLGDSVFWTDSTAVLKYIANETTRFRTFVANRVAAIIGTTAVSQWKYICSQQNPADYASRGQDVDAFMQKKAWISGPDFLTKPASQWPATSVHLDEPTATDPEMFMDYRKALDTDPLVDLEPMDINGSTSAVVVGLKSTNHISISLGPHPSLPLLFLSRGKLREEGKQAASDLPFRTPLSYGNLIHLHAFESEDKSCVKNRACSFLASRELGRKWKFYSEGGKEKELEKERRGEIWRMCSCVLYRGKKGERNRKESVDWLERGHGGAAEDKHFAFAFFPLFFRHSVKAAVPYYGNEHCAVVLFTSAEAQRGHEREQLAPASRLLCPLCAQKQHGNNSNNKHGTQNEHSRAEEKSRPCFISLYLSPTQSLQYTDGCEGSAMRLQLIREGKLMINEHQQKCAVAK
ncbi:hypothetical protein MHYP_G00110830 [Metynnis hypsauchen]